VIRAVHISNYRSVGPDASLEFPAGEAPRLVTLAGANNVGKSNVLDALRLVRDVLRDGPVAALHRRGGFRGVRRFGCDDPVRIVLEAEDSEGVVFWGLAQGVEDERLPYWFDWGCVLSPAQAAQLAVQVEDMYRTAADTGRPQPRAALLYDILRARPFASTLFPLWLHGGSDGPHPTPSTSRGVRVGLPLWAERDPLWGRFYASLLTMRMYHPWPPTLRPAQRVSDESLMEDDGSNWAATLQRLSPDAMMLLRVALARLVPDLVDLHVIEAGDQLVVEFAHALDDGVHWVDAVRESDGTLRTAALLTALLQDPLPAVLGIEEPELAVHVRALPMLADYCESAARRASVLLTTHSPELLDHLPADGLRVVRMGVGGTEVLRLEEAQRRVLRAGVASVGDLLREEGLRPEDGDG
jgi:predicted ATPase